MTKLSLVKISLVLNSILYSHSIIFTDYIQLVWFLAIVIENHSLIEFFQTCNLTNTLLEPNCDRIQILIKLVKVILKIKLA